MSASSLHRESTDSLITYMYTVPLSLNIHVHCMCPSYTYNTYCTLLDMRCKSGILTVCMSEPLETILISREFSMNANMYGVIHTANTQQMDECRCGLWLIYQSKTCMVHAYGQYVYTTTYYD